MVVASFQIAPGKAGRSLVTILGSSPSVGLTQRFTGAHQDPPPAPYEARRDRPDRPRPRGARHVRRDETREQELRHRPSDRARRAVRSLASAGERRPIEPRRRLQARECPVDCAFTEDEVEALVDMMLSWAATAMLRTLLRGPLLLLLGQSSRFQSLLCPGAQNCQARVQPVDGTR